MRSAAALRAAMLALLEREAFDAITVRDICAESGVHYATFFRHYPGKEALLDAVAQDQIAELCALSVSARVSADFTAGFTALCRYVEAHRELWAVLLNGGAGAAMREEWVLQSQLVAANETPVNTWLPPELGTIIAATMIAETLAWWVAQPPGVHSAEAVAALLLRLQTGSTLARD